RLVGVGFVACVLPAQMRSENLTISGVVVNSATGEPIQRALVRAVRFDSPKQAQARERPVPAEPFTVMTFTDAGGAFRFTGLAPGNYQVQAEKPQFTPQVDRKAPGWIDLTTSLEGVRIPLAPLGVITGKVSDTEGQPLRGVNILALSARVE